MLIESFSGIRGIFNKDIDENVIRKYAYCFYKQFKEPKIVVGCDTRPSSRLLKDTILDVFNYIIDVDYATTPMIELAVRKFKADGGIIITASHNEPEWNGIKFLDGSGAILRPKEIDKVIRLFQDIKDIDEADFLVNYLSKASKKAHYIEKRHNELIYHYKKFLRNFITKKEIKLIKNKKIVIDPNGGTGYLAKEILESFGVKVVGVNMEIGKFKRKIEPNEKSLKYLIKYIKDADFAAGFDCDADRVEIVLKPTKIKDFRGTKNPMDFLVNGKVVNGNYLLAMVVDEVLSEEKKPENVIIVTNDATSGVVKEIVENQKAKLIETEVGETNVLYTMLLNDSPVGGEGSSGGIILPPSRCRDGILTVLFLLKLIAKRDKSIGDILKEYPKYYTIRKNIKFDSKRHDKIKNKLKEFYLKKGFKIQETGDITGGLKVFLSENSYVWFRASKTEADVFRIISDGNDLKQVKKSLGEAVKVFKGIR